MIPDKNRSRAATRDLAVVKCQHCGATIRVRRDLVPEWEGLLLALHVCVGASSCAVA